MRNTPFLLAAFLSLAACAQTPGQRAAAAARADGDRVGLERELAGFVPQKSSGCISDIDTRGTTSIKGYGPVIVYRVGGNVKYVSTTTGGCESIARGDTLVTVQTGGQLCRGDIARTIDQVQRFQTGSCGFGDFVRYERPR